jgi:hypothetical protein
MQWVAGRNRKIRMGSTRRAREPAVPIESARDRRRGSRDAFRTENLAEHQAQALGANGRRGAVPAGSLRQIDHLDATDDVLERNIAYR